MRVTCLVGNDGLGDAMKLSKIQIGALVVLSLLLVTPSVAGAEENHFKDYMDGNQLLRDCSHIDTAKQRIEVTTGDDAYMAGNCYGYVTGITTAFHWTRWAYDKCYADPGETNAYVLIDLVVDYLKKNPKNRGWGASQVVAWVLQENFPCSK